MRQQTTMLRTPGVRRFLSLMAIAALSTPAYASGDPPNIIVLYADDQSFYTANPYGDGLAHTPVLEALAGEGMTFNRGYAGATYCKPSRNSLFTSLYPHEHGSITNQVEVPPASPATSYLTTQLSVNGYTTYGVGKWHSSFTAQQAGFDTFVDTSANPVQEARDFLSDQAANPDGPFFLYVSFHDTHGPWETIQRNGNNWGNPLPFDGQTNGLGRNNVNAPRSNKPAAQDDFESEGFDKLRRQGLDPNQPLRALLPYYRAARDLDRDVGKILQRLAKVGLDQNTIVMFTSDQGVMAGNHRLWYKGPALYNEIVHVPMIVRWPGTVPPGTQSDHFFTTVDIAPTLLDAVGINPPNSFSGSSLYQAWQGTGSSRKFHVFQTATDMPDGFQVRAIQTFPNQLLPGEWKLVLYENDSDELYDLENDPFEMNNLIDDPARAGVKALLNSQLNQWMNQHDDPARFVL